MLEYDLNQIQSLNFNQINPKDFREAQTSDATIHRVMEYKRHGRFPSKVERMYETHNVKLLMREWKNLYLDGGILRRKKGAYSQLVVPRKFHPIIFRELHGEMGHLGSERVLQLAREIFYWPRMIDDITHHVTKVCDCLKQRKPQ